MKYLRESILLCEENNHANTKLFKIRKMINRGASAVCYEAYHQDSGRGILKEFYPYDVEGLSLNRDAEGQLFLEDEAQWTHERFREAEKKYLESYKMLLAVKQNGKEQDLDTFIPHFEIYRGCNKEGQATGSIYIWSPEPKVETFDKICDEIHKHPNKNPEQKLATVLTAIDSLTKCIKSLHFADILHRDIKPSNFGFVKRGNETLTQSISLFDVNSMCNVFEVKDAMGNDGYWEPERSTHRANNQTDIYSIGATLFHAIIVTKEVKDNKYLYKEEYYDSLQELVNSSKLIQASEWNSHPHLRKALTTILQRSLCARAYRYRNCEEMLKDIETALYYALPSEIAGKIKSGQKWVLADAEAKFDRNADKNSNLTIKYHLYEHPLYSCVQTSATDLNVLVFGFGNYGQKFLDASLQVGQMRGRTLNVTVVSDSAIDKEVYLSDRPALGSFFNIDGGRDDKESYGNIDFENRELNRINSKEIAAVLKSVMVDNYDRKKPDYVFIALGDDKLNNSTAKACSGAVKSLGLNSVISYVSEDSQFEADDENNIYPVLVNESIKNSAIHADIERMAFNSHLIWEDSLNVDYSRLRANFRKPYNHDSSVSNVLAVKYKLFDMGIDLSEVGFKEAAKKYQDEITKVSNREIRNELIWIEHRRWVTEKLCLGWRTLEKLETCASGATKDERKKRHICILRSKPEQMLSTEYWSADNHSKWDSASKDELKNLDALERMSVKLHRMYVRKAKEVKKDNLLSLVHEIRELIENDRKMFIPFQEWYLCIKDIWTGELDKVNIYQGLKNAFLDATAHLPKDRRKAICEQVKAFEAMFYPVLASVKYRDYKQEDVKLVDNLPFILTYNDVYMVIPYTTDSTQAFDNVASATVVNPERILYLYLAESPSDIEELKSAVPYTVSYMKKKQIKSGVEFVIGYTRGAGIGSEEDFTKELKEVGNGKVRAVKMIALPDVKKFPELLEEYLKQRADKKPVFAIEENGTNLYSMLRLTSIYEVFASYRFSSKERKFVSTTGCDLFRYINKLPYITVSDMISLEQSSGESSSYPQFYKEYKELWKKYTDNRSTWKTLCEVLGDHCKNSDLIVSFKKKNSNDKEDDESVYQYYIPFACRKNVTDIFSVLKQNRVLEKSSDIIELTADSCQIIVKDKCGYKALYDRLFSNVYALMVPKAINVYLDPKSHEVKVEFNNLQVQDVKLSSNKGAAQFALLKYFAEKGYIINLIKDGNDRVSFTYATAQIKELLTTAGKMLEIYIYHSVKELGKFDDVVSGYEIDWEGTDAKNEMDCIITKGFRALFVEVKARQDIEQGFYFKLEKLTDKFGVNPIAVLVADTQEKPFYDHAQVNNIQRTRGKMMDVVTIWREDEIQNIGETLLSVLDGSYKEKQ